MCLQVFQTHIFKSVFMGGFEPYFGGTASQKPFTPSEHAKAPEIARLQARKVPLRVRRDQIVASDDAEFEEFTCHQGTNRVLTDIIRPCIAAAIPKKSGHGIRGTAQQGATKDIFRLAHGMCDRPLFCG
jgi:hypothetical protein